METLQKNNPKYLNKSRSDNIIAWLHTHPLISRSALCAQVDYEYKDFQKVLDRKMTIKAAFLDGFENELRKYGYTVPE